MLTSEERLKIGLKVLERLRSDQRVSRLLHARKRSAIQRQNRGSSISGSGTAQVAQSGAVDIQDISLPDLIEQSGPLPENSLLLGLCEDGLPFTLELNNPAPGSLLIAGDPGSGKQRLLHAILSSTSLLNEPRRALFSVISAHPQDYEDLEHNANCQAIYSLEDWESEQLIHNLATMVEQRRRSSASGPAIVLAVDDLGALNKTWDVQTFAEFYSLVRHGPRSRVWTIAALSSLDAPGVDERLLGAFRTRLIGRITAPELADYLSGLPGSGATELQPGAQFCVLFGDEWTRFWICQ